MRFLFIMDPLDGILPDKDTSYAFMLASVARGHQAFHCQPHEVSNHGHAVAAWTREVLISDGARPPAAAAPQRMSLTEFDAVLIRKDPPFDAAYLHLTQQLSLAGERLLVVNAPDALRAANEKLYAFQFAEFMPETLVSSNTQELLEFVMSVGGRAVVKPLDGAGGAGVMGLEGGSRNTRGILDYVTREGRELAMVQAFQPEVVAGDKRVLLLDGELLGAIRRVPREDDIRANIHVGGRVEATDLTPAEQRLVDTVGPRLKAVGLFFVGLDLIAEKLIEINVTSPTGIQELSRLSGTDHAARVILWLEANARN